MSLIMVIGSGFSGLSAAAHLARAGHQVHVFEKNAVPGGRARQLVTREGYTFDMGPSWYWMPEVFDRFFEEFGYRTADLYQLSLLDPAFDIVFGREDILRVPSDFGELASLLEQLEPGASSKLNEFMAEAEAKYALSMDEFIYKPGLSLREYVSFDVIKKSASLSIFSSFSKHVRKYFSHPKIIALMEFPILFLGAMPKDTPALYSMMNYAGLKLGTWYPNGGFGKVVDAFVRVARDQGVMFHFQSPVEKIHVSGNEVQAIQVNGKNFYCDGVIASADYHHVEQRLLSPEYRNYSAEYWQRKVMAPSCLIFYIGVNKKIPALNHHTLFFDESLTDHAHHIYRSPSWPEKPLFYVSCTSRSDAGVAPAGHENLFILMPIAPGLYDDEQTRERYFRLILGRLEKHTGEALEAHIDYKASYCVSDFLSDYHSFKGNAYGLANTLLQTAVFKPSAANKYVQNLFYTGQLTVPGPGVPPAIISGKISAGLMLKHLKSISHEGVI